METANGPPELKVCRREEGSVTDPLLSPPRLQEVWHLVMVREVRHYGFWLRCFRQGVLTVGKGVATSL